MKLNQKGAVDLMFVVLIIVVAAVGYFVYTRVVETDDIVNEAGVASEAGSSSRSGTTDNDGSEEAEQEDKVIKIDDAWSMSDLELLGTNKARYAQVDGTATLNVFSDNPAVFYSSNAPVKCILEDGEWVHYQNSNNEGFVANDTDCASKFTTSQIEGIDVMSRSGGALGQYRYISVFQVGSDWYTVSDFVNIPEGESNDVSESKIAETEKRVTSIVADLIN